MCPSDFRQQSKVRAAQMDRLLRRISIARGNWLTVLIRCAAVSMNGQRVATDNSKAINRAIRRDSSRGGRVRDRKVSRDRTVSSRVANKLVAHKTVAARRAKETVVVSIVTEESGATGGANASFPLKTPRGLRE